MKINSKIIIDKSGNITVSINNKGVNIKFAYYLYYFTNINDNKLILKKTDYISNNSYSVHVDKSGYYFVKCFVSLGDKRYSMDSETVLYICDDIKDEFQKIVSGSLDLSNVITSKIDYFKAPSPQNDFCVVSYKSSLLNINKERVIKWCKDNHFNCYALEKFIGWNTNNFIICDDSNIQDGQHPNGFIFSGYVWSGDKFYFGQEDFNELIKPSSLYDKLGMFSLLDYSDEQQIKVTTDYFGYNKLFYFLNDEVFVLANSYHLLLMLLSGLGIDCTLDEDIILGMFASNVTLFRQPITQELIVKNTYQLNLTDEVIINKYGWNFTKRSSYYVLRDESNVFNVEEYKKLINESKEELINNVRCALDNEKFTRFVLELSGGKDSRTTLAAMTNIEKTYQHVLLKSTNHEPNDLDIAVALSNMFGYSYNDCGEIYNYDDVLNYIKYKRSFFCGVRYLWSVENKHSYNKTQLVFNGECFESLAVRYYSGTLKNICLDNLSNEELIDEYSILLSKQPILDYSKVSSLVKKQLISSLESIPSSTSMEAFDNMYMFYRASATAGNLDRVFYSSATCMPLQSKSLLKAKKIWICNFKDEKIIYDITYALNPVLGALPYNNEKYNITRDRMQDNLLFEDVRFSNFATSLNIDKSKWETANKNFDMKSQRIYLDSYVDRGSVPDVIYDNVLFCLYKLSKILGEVLIDNLLLPIFYYVKSHRSDADEIRIIHNKLTSIVDCFDALGMEENLKISTSTEEGRILLSTVKNKSENIFRNIAKLFKKKSLSDCQSKEVFNTKLTMMMEPFAKNHIQEHAKLILNNQMPILYSSLVLDISSNIDWDLKSIEQGRNSVYMWHQSLYSVFVLCKYWHENNDAVLLDKALELFDSWCLWYSINKKGAYFDEHAVSNRLSVICYLNNILIGSTNNSFRDEHYSIFSELIHEHFVWLSDDKHYVNNNHGLIIDNAIIQASMKLKNVINVENVVNKSIKRIYQMFCDSFDEDGVNNENSPEYHMVNMNMYGFLNKFIQTYNLDFPESELLKTGLAKAIQVSSFMIRDDGCTPTIGDTYVKPYSYIQNKNGVVCYKTAKFGVIKADGFYFSIKCGGTSFHHKHIDETSITLRYNQTNIFVDGGSFSYDRKDVRSSDAISYKSHSGFFTEDFKDFRFNDFTIDDLKNKTCLDLLYNQQPKVGFIATNNLINDISITRKVHFFSQSDINIIDEGISESNRIWIQQFILHPDAKIIESQDNKLLFNIRGLNVDINVSGKCYLELEDTLYSEQFMQGITCKRVKFYFEGKSCLFNTNIKISLL